MTTCPQKMFIKKWILLLFSRITLRKLMNLQMIHILNQWNVTVNTVHCHSLYRKLLHLILLTQKFRKWIYLIVLISRGEGPKTEAWLKVVLCLKLSSICNIRFFLFYYRYFCFVYSLYSMYKLEVNSIKDEHIQYQGKL